MKLIVLMYLEGDDDENGCYGGGPLFGSIVKGGVGGGATCAYTVDADNFPSAPTGC